MRVAFRVDASRSMGTGHVMRCLTLADALSDHGAECFFIHRAHAGNMAATIRARGHAVLELPPPTTQTGPDDDVDYARWLGVPLEEDFRQTQEALGEERPDWLVVDHYALDAEWETAMRPLVDAIAVLDDLANRSHDCDLLIDQNYFQDPTTRYSELVPKTAKRLCGPRYALLRPEYAQARRLIRPRRGPISRLLVFYGGVDPDNETGRALRVLSRPEYAHLAVDVVIGAENSHKEALRSQAEKRACTTVHGPRDHLVDLQIDADLALGAGGITTWERCALGLPTIVTAIAENQAPFNQALADDGVIYYLGHRRELDDESLANALNTAMSEPATLNAQAVRSWRVTDGLGALRITEAMSPTPSERLSLRTATQADKALYFEWANDPETRRQAHNPDPIPWSDHETWFDRRLTDPASRLWVLETPAGLPVGQIRVDIESNVGILDYSIDVAFRSRGWGTRLLKLGAETWQTSKENVSLTGETIAGNEASRRAFLRAGFLEEELGEGAYRYLLAPLPGRKSASTTTCGKMDKAGHE